MIPCMNRKRGSLIPLEAEILTAALAPSWLDSEFHGYEIARRIAEAESARMLTAYGSLYRALDRLERQGFLTSRWEDPQIAAAEQRPQRRLYKVTTSGAGALATYEAPLAHAFTPWPGLTT